MKQITPKPDHFETPTEEAYWHSAQDMAYRAGCRIEVRGEDVILLFDNSEEVLCRLPDSPRESRRPWFVIWSAVKARFPLLYRRR